MARVTSLQVRVVADLATLRGPRQGLRRLPRELDSSACTTWDFNDPIDRALAYETVLRGARTDDELACWLDAELLVGHWPSLYLPREVRAAWQRQHRVPAARGAGPDVPAL